MEQWHFLVNQFDNVTLLHFFMVLNIDTINKGEITLEFL